MKLRLGFLLCCAVLIGFAGVTAESRPETPWICCDDPSACLSSETCCDGEALGMGSCSEDLGGFCMEKCKRVAFTPDGN